MRDLFDRARTLPPSQQLALLDNCPENADLRDEVMELLQADQTLGSSPGTTFLQALDRRRAAALLASVEHADELAPQDSLGRYRVISTLGRGGMGVVYLAHDPLLERDVALKVLPAYLSQDETANRALAQEARAASATDHPNIATVHDVGETADGQLFIVMPHYEGSTLRQRLEQGPLSVPKATAIARQVVSALAAAHAQGIIHRDIKPANLLLTADGTVKVLDFGVATVLRSGTPQGAVRAGTPAYMSPEQALGAHVDGRSDLWAVGVVLREMLAGGRPKVGDTPTLPTSVPLPLRSVVQRCLEAESDRRFPDAAALLAALDKLNSAGTARTRSRYAGRLGAAGVAAALGLGGVLLLGPAPEEGAALHASRATAVFPLATAVADTALARVGRELVITVSATLGSVSDGGVVDPQAILTAVPAGTPAPSGPETAELALRLGASQVLHGSLLRLGGDSVRVEVDLIDLDTRQAIAHASASAPIGSLLALTDAVTLGLVRGLWREGEVPAPSLGGLATASVPALQSYLDGERAFARGEFVTAIAAFEQAFSLDTTFWMAYWRSLYPRVYEGTPAADHAKVRAVVEHRAELSPPDRALIEMHIVPGLGQRLAAGLALTRAHPSYWPGWYAYGDRLLHDGPYTGTGYEQARVALEAVVRLQPRFTPAWVHLFWLGIYQRDTAAAGRALAQVRNLAGADSEYFVRDDLRYESALLAVLRGGGPNDSLIARDAAHLVRTPPAIAAEPLANGFLEFSFSRAQIALNDAILALGPSRELAVEMLLGRGRAWAARGAWDTALASSVQGARLAGTPKAALSAYAIAAAGAALGGLNDTATAPTRRELLSNIAILAAADSAELHWLDGLAAYARRDTAAIDAARRALASMVYQHAGLLEASLAGLLQAAAGDRAGAGRILAELEEAKAERYGYADYAPAHTWLTGMNRLLGARFLVQAGERDRAARLLTWHEAIRWDDTNPEEWVNRTLEPLARLERGRIAEARGLDVAAAEHYTAFLQRFDQPVNALVPLRQEAEAGLARTRQASLPGEART